MPRREYVLDIAAPLEKVWAFYDDIHSLPSITPPTTRITLPDPPEKMYEGVSFTLLVQPAPFYFPTLLWVTKITRHEPPHLFVDQQVSGPFGAWQHEHRFEALDETHTRLYDTVTYTPPFGPLGKIADVLVIRPQLDAMFRYRHKVTRERLEPPAAT
jgi:ligand-binding SRPBCC domain-containing protein